MAELMVLRSVESAVVFIVMCILLFGKNHTLEMKLLSVVYMCLYIFSEIGRASCRERV